MTEKQPRGDEHVCPLAGQMPAANLYSSFANTLWVMGLFIISEGMGAMVFIAIRCITHRPIAASPGEGLDLDLRLSS